MKKRRQVMVRMIMITNLMFLVLGILIGGFLVYWYVLALPRQVLAQEAIENQPLVYETWVWYRPVKLGRELSNGDYLWIHPKPGDRVITSYYSVRPFSINGESATLIGDRYYLETVWNRAKYISGETDVLKAEATVQLRLSAYGEIPSFVAIGLNIKNVNTRPDHFKTKD